MILSVCFIEQIVSNGVQRRADENVCKLLMEFRELDFVFTLMYFVRGGHSESPYGKV